MKNIVLIGMPGSGKTTVGKYLSEIMDYEFIDVDEYLEMKECCKITDIFKKYGEEHFRTLEIKYINELSQNERCVISTGGGVVKNEINIVNLKKNGVIFFLNRSVEEIYNEDHTNRPLLQNIENIYNLYNERNHLYNKYSDIVVDNDDTIETVAQKIKKSFIKKNK